VPLRWRKGLEANALFEADDAVLHLEGLGAQLEECDEGCH
jgi:hypothetical protein